MDDNNEKLKAETRAKIDEISRGLLRLHKTLLDDERGVYEAVHGAVASPHQMFQLVLSHPQFSWLGKISSLVALLDEAISVRRPATEENAQALLAEVSGLLKMEGEDKNFTEQFQRGLKRSTAAKANYDEAVKLLG